MTGEPVRVLVVDDHDLFRTGLATLLEEEGFEVANARSGEAALATLTWFDADVVVMDVNMPGISGIEATARVPDVRPGASVLMLSINRDNARIVEAVQAGASGYLLKDAELGEMVRAIRAAASGQSVLDPTATRAVMAHVRETPASEPGPEPVPVLAELSDRERQILVLLARGCDNTAIGERLFLSSSTVKHHVSRILHKLGVDNRLQAATFAIRNGLADEEPGAS